jgi:hypothetical protein
MPDQSLVVAEPTFGHSLNLIAVARRQEERERKDRLSEASKLLGQDGKLQLYSFWCCKIRKREKDKGRDEQSATW